MGMNGGNGDFLCTTGIIMGQSLEKVKNVVSVPDPTLRLFPPAGTLPPALRRLDPT